MSDLPESTPRVGRWTSETTWACPRPCLSPNHVDRTSCDVCHAVRPPLPETPAPTRKRVGGWRDENERWGCDCGDVITATRSSCHDCGCVRPAFVAPPAPTLPKPSPRFLTDAQVVGKEPIAGADDAGEPTPAEVIAWLSSDNPVGLSTSRHARKMLAVALAALRAVPVEGGEPDAWRVDEMFEDGEDYKKIYNTYFFAGDPERVARLRDALMKGRMYGTITPLYAHPAPDGDAARIPAALMRQYEHAAEKAESVGALKMLHKAEAAIGRWCLKAFATPTPDARPLYAHAERGASTESKS